MNRMKFETVFFLGPPGAGKTTIGCSLAQKIGVSFRTIDEFASQVYPPEMRSIPMTDEQVDISILLLFNNITYTNEIVEFAYHDYVRFLKSNKYPKFNFHKKVIITAPLTLCIKRNQDRSSTVQISYIERAWKSTLSLIELCSAGSVANTLILDTSVMDAESAELTIFNFLT